MRQPPGFRVESALSAERDSLVVASGELDVASAPELQTALEDATADADRVVVDLRSLTSMDSVGIALLLRTARGCAIREVELVLVPGPPNVQETFAMCGLLDSFSWADAG